MLPHVTPLDIYFYNGTSFPHVDPGDAFVTWYRGTNQNPPLQGYKVVHVSFIDGW